MTNRALLLIAFALAIFTARLGSQTAENPATPAEKSAAPEEKPAAPAERPTTGPARETITITATEPVAARPPESTRPTFRWIAEAAKPGSTYDLTLFEVPLKFSPGREAPEVGEPRVVFENKGLKENAFAYPGSADPLDKTKFYGWRVIANDPQGNQIGQTVTPLSFVSFAQTSCWPLIAFPSTVSSCQQPTGGNSNASVFWYLFSSGPPTATWTLTGPPGSNPATGTVNCSGGVCYGTVPVNWPASQPGTYQGTLTVRRGTCLQARPITLLVYPNIQVQVWDYPSTSQIQRLCWGDDATLKMLDVNGNPSPAGCQVKWEYSADNGSTWKPLGQGNPFNTNPINNTNPLFTGLSCTGANITLLFRGTLAPNCLNLPASWPPACPNVKTTSLTVDCPTQPGNITVAPKDKICSNTTTPPYPQTVTLTLGGYIGNIGTWTVNNSPIANSNGQQSIMYSINSAGTYQFCVPVTNGTCQAMSACKTVVVEDPIQGTIQVTPTQTPEICWGEDKVTMNFVPSTPLPPGTLLSWSYQINCVGPWIPSNVTGTTQNSNDVLLAPSYPPNINPCTASKVCWKVTATSGTGICLPVDIGPVTINIIKPFDPTSPPVISPATVPIKCPGKPVMLTATNFTCATGPFSYQWYLDGLPLPNETSQSIQAIEPGNYTVEVCNKNKCSCIETAPVLVRDCLTLVEIKGPCTCKDGDLVTLTASVSSQVIPGPAANCGSPYTYLWSTGQTTASIQVKCPTASTDYWVEVKDGTGCKTKATYTIKRCQ